MVDVAHSVRAPGCGPGGSGFDPHHSPQKSNLLGCRQAGKAQDFDSCISLVRVQPSQPNFGPLAQLAEHLTFNQGVWGPNPQWLTKGNLLSVRIEGFLLMSFWVTLIN